VRRRESILPLSILADDVDLMSKVSKASVAREEPEDVPEPTRLEVIEPTDVATNWLAALGEVF
jgi:Na+-transporting methylmalonyl-CoA/oxaloacetate decarboxylase gamma subunit